MIQSWIRLFLILCLSHFLGNILAQSSENRAAKESLFQYLQDQQLVQLELVTNIDSLIINKLEPYEAKGFFTIRTDSTAFSLPVKVTIRGKFRRRTCDFPPLLLDFPKDDLKDLGYKKADKYKLVTHCLSRKHAANYIMKEFLIYKLYQALEPSGFGVVFFPIKYRDLDSGAEKENYAFLIESGSELEDRLDSEWCKCLGIHTDSISQYHRELVYFFQYMIGNRDMNMHIEHNVRFLESLNYTGKVPVPYDFDFSDFVKTPYAFPDQSVTFDRSTLALGKNEEEFEKVYDLFTGKKEELLDIVNNFSFLHKRQRKKCRAFLNDFYRLIERRNFMRDYLSS